MVPAGHSHGRATTVLQSRQQILRATREFRQRNHHLSPPAKFWKNAYGKAYQISAQKLVNTMSIIAKNESFEGRTFFCSELVAAAYKRVGLLPAEISSTQYWPGSFSTERTLPMQMGAYLGPEIRIDFSEAE
eukprot:TRINITY_DN1850_c0_g1_i10.p1 TRINITY_DN1850_c0_g1~~TRINITY_DN1850_c0_g1_i10.p1  ORF type:complete len:132 (-),score=10.03 TRINITY_DN1850_c0_g1_i10:111-506(-)